MQTQINTDNNDLFIFYFFFATVALRARLKLKKEAQPVTLSVEAHQDIVTFVFHLLCFP